MKGSQSEFRLPLTPHGRILEEEGPKGGLPMGARREDVIAALTIVATLLLTAVVAAAWVRWMGL